MLKKTLLSIGIISSIVCAGWAVALHAQDYGLSQTASRLGYDKSQTVYTIVGTVVSGVLALIAIVFFGFSMYAGLRWMTARGNQEYVEKAKSTLSATIMGLVVTLMAYALTQFIFVRLQTVPDPNQELLDAGNTGPRVVQPDSCFNQVKDGLETDFNCGGTCDKKCADGRVCIQNTDCQSNNCLNGSCMPGGASCTNAIKDGLETDVDCGGTVCPPCGAGRYCRSASDCVSGQSCTMSPTRGLNTCGGY